MPEARRITGPHLLLDRPGAALELLDTDGFDPEVVASRAAEGARRLGWAGTTAIRRHRTGASVGLEAPPDLLYTATEVLEWAVADDPEAAWERVEAELAEEQKPALRVLLDLDGPVFADDDFGFTAGLGRHSRTWPLDALPSADEVGRPERIPFVFLTGTNGKTTTTRMLASIAAAAGFTPGWTSSDAFGVGEQTVEQGDWTGPGAARAVLRRGEVDYACLETARGGLLRRGLVLPGADAAVVTNVSSDHLGEWGIHDVYDMARAKLGVAVGLREGGVLVVNGDDANLRRAVPEVLERRPDLQVHWFSGQGPDGEGVVGWADAERIVLDTGEIALSGVPSTFGGTARHNVENALAAALAARATGIGLEAIARGLAAFVPSVARSRGRMNRFVLPSGATALVDFAHNPDGVARVGRTVGRWPAERRVVLLGQAGDRTDADLADLARVVAALEPDRVVLKEMKKYLRDRPEGEVTAILRRELVAAGVSGEAIDQAPTETAGVRQMVEHAAPGDLLLLFVQADLDAALAVLEDAGARPD